MKRGSTLNKVQDLLKEGELIPLNVENELRALRNVVTFVNEKFLVPFSADLIRLGFLEHTIHSDMNVETGDNSTSEEKMRQEEQEETHVSFETLREMFAVVKNISVDFEEKK
jgi:hypothetical protein